MRMTALIAAAFALAACSRGETYESGGTVVDTVVNHQDTTRGLEIDLGTTRDTLSLPVIGMQTETLIVKKPVVKGRRPVEVKRPTVDVNRKP